MSSHQDRLEVKVIEARHLSYEGTNPNSFAQLDCGLDRRQTRLIAQEGNPEWRTKPFIFSSVLASDIQTLILTLIHRDASSGRDIDLGWIQVDLATFFNAPKVEIDSWYPLVATAKMAEDGNIDTDLGEVRLGITFFNEADPNVVMSTTVGGMEVKVEPPNLLKMKVLRASKIGGGRSSVDASVQIQIGDVKVETKNVASVDPLWDEELSIPIVDSEQFIEVAIMHNTLLSRTCLGRVRLTIVEVAAAGEKGVVNCPYNILNENLEFDGVNRGILYLEMVWVHDEATAKLLAEAKARGQSGWLLKSFLSIFKKKENAEEDVKSGGGIAGGAKQLVDVEDEDPDAAVNAKYSALGLSPYELQVFLEKQREERQKNIDEYLESMALEGAGESMKEGDYTIQVHLLECMNLRSKDENGVSDPQVIVTCMGKTSRSKIMRRNLSPYYDEVFYFSFKSLNKDQLREGKIVFNVVDCNFSIQVPNLPDFALLHQPIGSISVDLQTVYKKKDHEVYKKWGVLFNSEEAEETGEQGRIRFSIVVLGPGDSQVIHDPSKEVEDENSNEEDAEDDADAAGDTALVGDDVPRRLNFLVVNVLKAEGLPGFASLLGPKGLYCSAVVEFGPSIPAQTSRVLVMGTTDLTVQFDEELWIPVWLPCAAHTIRLSVIHSEFGGIRSIVVASSTFELGEVPKVATEEFTTDFIGSRKYAGPRLRLLHFYGANPTVKTSTRASVMNKYPSLGNAYRGNILIGTRLITEPGSYPEMVRTRKIYYSTPRSSMPVMSSYFMRVMFYQATDLMNGSFNNWSACVTFGKYSLRTSFKSYEQGSVTWLEIYNLDNIELPYDITQIPDVIITISKGNEKKSTIVSYIRVPAASILKLGMEPEAVWYELKHDLSYKTLTGSTPTGFPGSLLMRMVLASSDDVTNLADWDSLRKKATYMKPYILRVGVYQCRGLPSLDDSGLMDPYVKLRFDGKKIKTKVLPETRNPCYYECHVFDTQLPSDVKLSHPLVVEIWDNNPMGKSNVPIASLHFPIAEAEFIASQNDPMGSPKWFDLVGMDGTGNMGEVLLCVQVIPRGTERNIRIFEIQPATRKVWLDCQLVGIRSLKKKGTFPLYRPYVALRMFDPKLLTTCVIQSCTSRNPSAYDPNFLERQMLEINLPEDPTMAPALEVLVYDKGLSGRSSLLGSCVIDMRPKLPWNPVDYVAPRQHSILEEAVRVRQALDASHMKVANTTVTKASKVGDDNAEEDVRFKDSGYGVFPTLPGQTPGAKYLELPTIVDREEENLRMKRKKKVMEDPDIADVAGTGDSTNSKSENAVLRKYCKFPESWADTKYMAGRDWWMNDKSQVKGYELEHYLKMSAFENYTLQRGHVSFNRRGLRKSTLQDIGYLRGVIRVCVTNPKLDLPYNKFMQLLRKETKVIVRLYVIRANALQPKDFNGFADPYLKVSLGGTTIKARDKVIEKNLNPDFFQRFDLETKLPGPCALTIGVWDANDYTSDKLIGETTIDLEDRWFNPKWTEIESQNLKKPLESRNLYTASLATTQGLLLLWLDIFNVPEALKNKPVDITGPEIKKVEVRIVCWRSRNTPNMDGNLSDTFAKFWMDGGTGKTYSTDVHFRCKTHAAIWNWRIKFWMELPLKTREHGRLRIQAWDWDLFGDGDMIGEGKVDLYDWLLKAYHSPVGVSVFPFKELTQARDAMLRDKGMGGITDNAATEKKSDAQETEEGDEDTEEISDEDTGESGEAKDENTPLLDKKEGSDVVVAAPVMGEPIDKPVVKKSKKVEVKELTPVEQIYSFLGIGDAIPDDAKWIKMSQYDIESKSYLDRGDVAITIEIVSEEDAKEKPVGSARGSPNENPYLPYPPGRLDFLSLLNPITFIYEFCGLTGLCVCCCLICILLLALIGTMLSSIMSFIAALKMIQQDFENGQIPQSKSGGDDGGGDDGGR